jgi:cell division septation protein DedD
MMRWITIICFSAALGWTTLSFVAYRDWDLAFQSSLAAWLVFAVSWAAMRLSFLGSGSRRHASEKAKTHKAKTDSRNRLAIAGRVSAAALGVFVLAVLAGQLLEKRNKPNKEPSSTAPRSANERSSKPQRLQPVAKGEAKDKAAEEIAQKTEGLWSVQVGAFRSEKDAVKVATTLKGRGYEAYVIRAQLDAADLFRTKVGRFRTREEAEILLATLKDKEAYATAFVARM